MKYYAVVTGAERGLGYELTHALLKKGYTVFAGQYRTEWNLLENLKPSYPDQLMIIPLDVSNLTSVKNAIKQIEKTTQSIDLIINNSAITGDNQSILGDEINYDEIHTVIDVNAIGALRVTNELFHLLKNGHQKRVVSISSEAGSIYDCGRQGWFAYCSSKAALNMLTAIIHNNLNPIGGQAFLFHPGWMKTWLSGTYHDEGPLTPDISANAIVDLLENHPFEASLHPYYLDYQGNPLPF